MRGSRPSQSLSLMYVNELENYTISNEALEDPSFRDNLIALGSIPPPGRATARGQRWRSMAVAIRRTTCSTPAADTCSRGTSSRRGSGSAELTTITRSRPRRGIPPDRPRGRRGTRGGSVRLTPTATRTRSCRSSSCTTSGFPQSSWMGTFRGVALERSGVADRGLFVFQLFGGTPARHWGRPRRGVVPGRRQRLDRPMGYQGQRSALRRGARLAVQTPIGPIRADLGYRLNPIPGLLVNGEPEPRQFRFHFSIGQSF